VRLASRLLSPIAFVGTAQLTMSDKPVIDRRRFCATTAAIATAGPLGLLDRTLKTSRSMSAPLARAENPEVRPFRVTVPDTDLAELRRRVKATRWPDRETVPDATQGVQVATMQKLTSYWSTQHDWRKVEARLNAVPNFMTTIDGLDIHFIHVRSKHENALPVIITHGWPGSVIEQLKVIDLLANPTAHGANASDAFHVVIPSLPGYGFSAKPTAPGWEPTRIARAWTTLMKRLGYTKFVAQGGDWGNAVSETMALQAPPELLAISTNMPAAVPPDIDKAIGAGSPPPSTLTADERRAWDQLAFFYKFGLGYANEMSLRPQTLYGIVDSPAGLAAWMIDHDAASYALIARVFDGATEGLTRDDIVDNVSLYWLTNTAISSARLYWDSHRMAKGGFFTVRNVQIPVAVMAFPDEIYQAPQTWAERAYPKLLRYGKMAKGGHFAAWEQPEAFSEELRLGFRSLRK
jgi:pimeloyl-ACP methyl ester carboxylesterase